MGSDIAEEYMMLGVFDEALNAEILNYNIGNDIQYYEVTDGNI